MVKGPDGRTTAVHIASGSDHASVDSDIDDKKNDKTDVVKKEATKKEEVTK